MRVSVGFQIWFKLQKHAVNSIETGERHIQPTHRGQPKPRKKSIEKKGQKSNSTANQSFGRSTRPKKKKRKTDQNKNDTSNQTFVRVGLASGFEVRWF